MFKNSVSINGCSKCNNIEVCCFTNEIFLSVENNCIII